MKHIVLLLFGIALGGGAALAVLFVLIGVLSPSPSP
jgi:hypothetical protein